LPSGFSLHPPSRPTDRRWSLPDGSRIVGHSENGGGVLV
jgi:hypothetical protein